MTQEEKQLLIKDLCARLPHGVKFASFCEDMIHHSESVILRQIYWNADYNANGIEGDSDISTIIEFVRPYLRPMSSMTDEEKHELYNIRPYFINSDNIVSGTQCNTFIQASECQDWLNAHHFDYRGLIPMGLALEAPEGMYNN